MSLIKQTKFKIYTRKLHWLPLGELQQPFFFAKTKAAAACLGFPISFTESTKYHPQNLLSTTPKECTGVQTYGHVTAKFSWMDRSPNCLSYGATVACASCIRGALL